MSKTCASPRATRKSPFLFIAGLAVAAFSAAPALADDDDHHGGGAVHLINTVPIPTSLNALHGYDISWVDASTQRYYLGDRSNASIDVVDAKTGTFLKAIKGGFAGVTFTSSGAGNNDTSGPNGVVTSGRWLFATDAPSRVVSIDLNTDAVVDSVHTDVTSLKRADELAYDPESGTLLVVNNADDPPFATLITVDKSTGKLTPRQRITFDTAHVGFQATNGAEQSVWVKHLRKFFISIPEINCTDATLCGGSDSHGAVVKIDPRSTGGVEAVYPIQFCQPAGLTLGPDLDLLVGCSQAFDTEGKAWSAADANTAAPISVILDARTGLTDRAVPGVSGNDEVWFNPGDGRYYLAARNQPGGPALGVINAETLHLQQLVPTVNVGGKPNVFPAGTAHSVAVNPHNNHVFVPLAANNVFPSCLNGCIAVFGTR
jgi:hypothetical protein